MKLLLLLLSVNLLSSCGTKKLAVDYADTIISHQMTKRLPLTSTQKTELQKDVERFLEDQKPVAEEILPLIDSIEIHPEKVNGQYRKFQNYYEKIADRFSLLFSKHMAKLSKEQQKEFFANLKDEDKQIMSKDHSEIMKSVEGQVKNFTGDITREQKKLLSQYEQYFIDRHRKRIDNRRKLHIEFAQLYQDNGDKVKLFHEAFRDYQREVLVGNKMVEILERLIPILLPEQKEHFRKEAREIKEVISYFLTVDY